MYIYIIYAHTHTLFLDYAARQLEVFQLPTARKRIHRYSRVLLTSGANPIYIYAYTSIGLTPPLTTPLALQLPTARKRMHRYSIVFLTSGANPIYICIYIYQLTTHWTTSLQLKIFELPTVRKRIHRYSRVFLT